MKKKLLIIISVFALLITAFAVFSIVSDTPVRHFKGEVIKIDKVDNHLVFTVKENDKTQHTVHTRFIDLFYDINSDKTGYAHNIDVGDYIEGTYHNEFPYKKEFAKEIYCIEK